MDMEIETDPDMVKNKLEIGAGDIGIGVDGDGEVEVEKLRDDDGEDEVQLQGGTKFDLGHVDQSMNGSMVDYAKGEGIVALLPDTETELPVAHAAVNAASETKCSDRHCAFCLTLVPAAHVLLCSKCNRRAYCSKKCQRSDWKSIGEGQAMVGGNGQGHKNWCGLEYGEEDLDWKVMIVPGKGLGIIAQRDFPKWSRIMVEGCQANLTLIMEENDKPWSSELVHPALVDLSASTQNLAEKYSQNALDCDPNGPVKQTVCLRMARVNHSCYPNADHVYEGKFNAKILFAERDIKAGDEIYISYYTKSEVQTAWKISPYIQQMIFSTRWQIECQPSCDCKNLELIKRRNEAAALYTKVTSTRYGTSLQAEHGVRNLQKYLTLLDNSKSPTVKKIEGLTVGYHIGIMGKKTIGRGIKFMNMRLEFERMVYHPESEALAITKEKIKSPNRQEYYNIFDRK